jgi:hypothetical protein
LKPIARLQLIVTLAAILGIVIYGPIAQLPHYSDFADQRTLLGVPNAANVLSNLGFAVVGLWGLVVLWPKRRDPMLASGWPGYVLFLVAIVLTAAGSAYYHLAPDNARLVWDRLPIALACAGLLAGVCAENNRNVNGGRLAMALALAAAASVAWWRFTEQRGSGDLRPYLLLQALTFFLIPMWQVIHRAPRRDIVAFGCAIGFYALAKVAEINDRELLTALHLSGHTLKHLLATAATAVIVGLLVSRVRNDQHAQTHADALSRRPSRL